MRILATGFAPFGGESLNPSWEAAKRLPRVLAGADITALELPTEFAAGVRAVLEAVERCGPDIVLCLGQAGGRRCVTIEKIAINHIDAAIPDNAGCQPKQQPVVRGGPAAYFATVPVEQMAHAVRAEGMPCEVSYSAGVYVCNCVMYSVLHHAAAHRPRLRAGFIHVPYSAEQLAGRDISQPCLPQADITRAAACAIKAAAEATFSA